jgi:signal peptidase I
MARKRDSAWIWITLAVIGGLIIVSGMALRISGTLGGPGYDLYDIPSRSMFPSVHLGDYILALANVYRNEVPPRGQIVVFKYLPDGTSYLIAETSDDEPLDNTDIFTVPDGDIFLLGDNRDHSSDSRIKDTVGYVPLALLRDKPVLVYWSKDLKRIGEWIQ